MQIVYFPQEYFYNDQRLKKIIEEIISSGYLQKDDLTILVVDAK